MVKAEKGKGGTAWSGVGRWGRGGAWVALVLVLLQAVGGCTGWPRSVRDWLTARDLAAKGKPRVIVVLGGGGIPSESGLIRTYYAAQAARAHPGVHCVVALPADQNPERASVGRMRDELVLRGVPKANVQMETRGRNTHEQAINTKTLLGETALKAPVWLVTSPEHGRRAVLCFRKAGFLNVGCVAAENVAAEADPGQGASLRYGFWGNLEAQTRYARELVALLYYKVRGWI